MINPRRASLQLLALLTLAALVAAALPPRRAAAQSAPAHQAPSPNGKIVYQSTQGGDGFASDIYVMDANGKHQTRLTDSPTTDDASPLWSPQGNQISFVTNRGSSYEIYLMDADGGNQRPLRSATNGGPVMGESLAWSPDGTRLAYAAGGNIYIIQVTGAVGDSTAPPVNVSAGKADGTKDIEVSWSPFGDRLVIRNSQSCTGCTDLYTVNVDGTGRTQITDAPGFDTDARWSPAGTLIAYEADRGGRGIYVKNADGTGPETKVSGAVGAWGGPAWSPDGTRLAFRSGAGNVYVVNADGSGLTLLTDVLANGGSDIFWSPDGTKVAFHNSNASFVDLYVVNADGARRATNYTRTRRDDEFAATWQRIQTP